MTVPRREFLALGGMAAIAPLAVPRAGVTTTEGASTMYGLIGKLSWFSV